jgi:hypothetical protein
MGAKKTGRKKKSVYRKYKEHMKRLKAIETALSVMRTVVATAAECASMRTISSKFETGGIVSPDIPEEQSIKHVVVGGLVSENKKDGTIEVNVNTGASMSDSQHAKIMKELQKQVN